MAPARQIRVMLVDDHEIMRDGLREVLQRAGDYEVVGQAEDGAAAVRVAQSLRPDVIIMDVMMPIKNGIDACREITEMLPDTKVLMLTAASEEDAVIEAVAAGATGYLQKYSGKDRLLNTVRDVAQGEYRLPADAIRRVFAGIRGTAQSKADTGVRRLTAREREILTLFAQGLSCAQIAETRGNQPVTVRNVSSALVGTPMVSCWRSCSANWTLRRCTVWLSMPEGLSSRLKASRSSSWGRCCIPLYMVLHGHRIDRG